MSDENEFIMKKDGHQPIDGFVPRVIESVGYGIQTATDPQTNKRGLVPISIKVNGCFDSTEISEKIG